VTVLCPYCCGRSRVLRTQRVRVQITERDGGRHTRSTVRRRRACRACGYVWHTREMREPVRANDVRHMAEPT
jgi:hypothetical protein